MELPDEYDAFLLASPFRAIHERILKPASRITTELFGKSISIQTSGEVPPGGRLAWRLAWLDRTGFSHEPDQSPLPAAAISDWKPFWCALSTALSLTDSFVELLISCLGIAEYLKTISAGGIGPAFRFDLPPQEPHG